MVWKKPEEDFYIVATQVQYDWVKAADLQLAAGRNIITPDPVFGDFYGLAIDKQGSIFLTNII